MIKKEDEQDVYIKDDKGENYGVDEDHNLVYDGDRADMSQFMKNKIELKKRKCNWAS